jgi:hypothetical protein
MKKACRVHAFLFLRARAAISENHACPEAGQAPKGRAVQAHDNGVLHLNPSSHMPSTLQTSGQAHKAHQHPLRTTTLAGLIAAAWCAPLALMGCATPGDPATSAQAAAPAASGAASGAAPKVAAAAASRPASGAAVAARPASGAASGATAAAAPSSPPGVPPFAVVMKDAKEIKGLFTAWQKDERLWIELKPEDFKEPFFLSPKLSSGIGEAMLFGGLMMNSPRLVQWRRVHNMVQLVAINRQVVAKAGTPEARAVEASISPSLLASTAVASQPHPERKTILIDAGAMFVGDLLGLSGTLQRTYRQNYGFDARNSAVMGVRGKPDLLVIETNNHYATASIAVPQPGMPPGAPMPTIPSGLPDARSLFLGLHYSLARLPAQPMAARKADPRVGYFLSIKDDFSDDLARTPRQRVVNRWRLEKKDPAAELSEPVKPITYWLDRNIPVKYRETITAGVLEWNKAFEKAGFKNAIVVKQQPDDADFDTLDVGVASLRWMVNREPVFGAIGPSHVDPRSGEILDADIGIESLSSRNLRAFRSQIWNGAASPAEWAQLLQVGGAPVSGHSHDHDAAGECHFAEGAAEQLGYALDVLAARGDIDPDGPEAQAFVLAYMKDTTMHEVGHTLGLRHNFRASYAVSAKNVADPDFTAKNAFTGSVMEYAPVNLPGPGEKAPAPFQTTLGPYDYWAIEYAYKPIAADQEAAELTRIASRSGEPGLGFGTDEDNFLGIDPDALHFDLGDDVLGFAKRRFDIAQDLYKFQETRTLKPNEDYAGLRRGLAYALRDAGRAAGVLLRQVGGVRTLRDYAVTGRDPLQPVAASLQRDSLKLVSQRLLSVGAFELSPALQRKLAPDFFERAESLGTVPSEYPLAQSLLDLQRAILNRLMSDALASRLVDMEGKAYTPAQAYHLREMLQQLETDIWQELGAKRGDISPARRELQREYVNRLAALVLKPGTLNRADARAQVRSQASALLARIDASTSHAGLSAEARAHLKDSAESLRSALAAPLVRAGV